jgi:carbonic anhydrase
MSYFLDLVRDPVFGVFLIVFAPLTIALIYRGWHGDGRAKTTVRGDRQGSLVRPAPRLAVVTCMDSRVPVEELLGLGPGEAHIIRNAGGIVTEDSIRSLLVSHYLLGTREFLIINHTDCGMMTFTDEGLTTRLERVTGKKAAIPFHAFRDLDANVRRQVETVKAHPWMPADVPVRGFIYDVRTGQLREVVDSGQP